MIELVIATPVRLSPLQAAVVIVLVGGVVLALVLGALMESAVATFLAGVLRLAGHRPPEKGRVATALDELEARLERDRTDREA